MNNDLINRHVLNVTIQFISFRGTLEAFVGYVTHSMGDSAPSIADVIHYLIKAETHKELLNWDVGIWRNTDGSWSLVSLATPPDIEQMRYRLEHFPISNTQCRWCLQDAKRLADNDLIVEKDIKGLPVHNSRCHKICMKPWLTMRNQVARADAQTTPQKASLI
ncbi:hypothetical protein [Pseudomonas sp. VI4.1]|uniref:hypothetical protein n=1 Tax=Pseudomonas sp. VI4.1 TaxID=1941346 RepID=UPI0009D5EABB|nr:hypothetical protein [Pseudomonas sp. VI4.1]OPK06784.1 hypothetical protein BZ163_29720 [Pseudomonas sp. VI4.1]